MKSFLRKLRHYFVPHEGNEYKAHIFRETSLGILLAIVIFSFVAGTAHKVALNSTNYLAAIYSSVLVDLANEDRINNSLNQLVTNPVLAEAARLKALDMASKGYFAHYGPDGTAPWDWMRQAGYEFVHAGENLAIDFTDSKDVDEAWMNSPTHRANILNSKFTEIGIAAVKGEYKGRQTIYVVQMFGTPIARAATTPVLTTPTPTTQLAQVSPDSTNPNVEGVTTEPAPTPAPKPTPSPTPSPKPTPTKLAINTVSTSSSLNEERQESFISVENIASGTAPATAENVQIKKDPAPLHLLKGLSTNPMRTLETVYALIATILLVGLVAMIGRDLQTHHLKHATGGVLLMVVVVAFGYIYKTAVFSTAVIVAVNSV